ncbi:MAG: CDP-diacylglycerol--glycerol-3-phosphate 3-phosphatidyltransferase [Lachnospiraceae bacterium]|nr:CDP-diacylglycerol--glycerol-3-phosphate 3-phosphatidyltransferase [Lachnospiraceae bacterium]
MNLPNKLTVLRVALIPFFVLCMMLPFGDGLNRYLAVVIFIIASLTDLLDGKIARKYNLVTNFGKFMDPLADKLLVCSALICLSGSQIPAWIVIIIISREFIVSGFRLIASDQGLVLAAGWWGKCKTVCQMIMVILLIVNFDFSFINVVEQILIYLSLALTIISMVDYIWQNREVLTKGGM